MIYGLQMGCCLLGRTMDEGIKTYREVAEKTGLEGVELDFSFSSPDPQRGIVRPRVLPSEIDADMEKKLLDFIKPFRTKGAHLPWGHHLDRDAEIQRESRQQINFGIEKCAELGLHFVTLHMDSKMEGISGEEKWNLLTEAVVEYLDCARKNRIVLTLETGSQGNIQKHAEIINRLDDPYLKATLDTGHSFRYMEGTKYKTLEGYIKEEKKILRNIHLHDYDYKTDHLAPGQGVMDFRSFIRALMEIDYKGNISMEYEPSSLEELCESINYVKSLEQG